MAKPPRFEITFKIDGREGTQKISALSISNNEFGEDPLMYAERLDGGHLGVYMAAPLTFRSASHLAFDILRGRLKDNSSVTALTASEIRLHFPRHRHGIRCVDGFGQRRNHLVRIRPAVLNERTSDPPPEIALLRGADVYDRIVQASLPSNIQTPPSSSVGQLAFRDFNSLATDFLRASIMSMTLLLSVSRALDLGALLAGFLAFFF